MTQGLYESGYDAENRHIIERNMIVLLKYLDGWILWVSEVQRRTLVSDYQLSHLLVRLGIDWNSVTCIAYRAN